MTTDPLPTHDTIVVPHSLRGIHLIEHAEGEILMMGWDGDAPQSIRLYKDSNLNGYTPGQQILGPFRLTLDEIPRQPLVSPMYLQLVPPLTPFIMFPEGYEPIHRDVQIVTRSGRVAQPPPIDRSFAGITAREEVHRDNDKLLHQLRTTQARISI